LSYEFEQEESYALLNGNPIRSAEAVFRMNAGWKNATARSDYSIPVSKGDEVTLTYYRGTASYEIFKGYINQVRRINTGKREEWEYTCWGTEAVTKYRSYSQGGTRDTGSIILSNILAACPLPSPWFAPELTEDIGVEGMGKQYCNELIERICNDNTINFYYDNSGRGYFFVGARNTQPVVFSSFSVVERELVEDISGVYNSVDVYSKYIWLGESNDYRTENSGDENYWEVKAVEINLLGQEITTNYSFTLDSHSTLGSYGLSTEIPFGQYWALYIRCDLGETVEANRISSIDLWIDIRYDNLGSANSFPLNIQVRFQPESNSDTKAQSTLATTTAKEMLAKKSQFNWFRLSFDRSKFKEQGIEWDSTVAIRYITLRITPSYSRFFSGGASGTLTVDGLAIYTIGSISYSDTESINSFGLREFIPDRAWQMENTTIQLYNRAKSYIWVQPTRSILETILRNT